MAGRTEELLEFTSNTPPVTEVFEADGFWIYFFIQYYDFRVVKAS